MSHGTIGTKRGSGRRVRAPCWWPSRVAACLRLADHLTTLRFPSLPRSAGRLAPTLPLKLPFTFPSLDAVAGAITGVGTAIPSSQSWGESLHPPPPPANFHQNRAGGPMTAEPHRPVESLGSRPQTYSKLAAGNKGSGLAKGKLARWRRLPYV